jgi:hypothetical protein
VFSAYKNAFASFKCKEHDSFPQKINHRTAACSGGGGGAHSFHRRRRSLVLAAAFTCAPAHAAPPQHPQECKLLPIDSTRGIGA